jgi:NADPH:quinone reductase-like Zn-dependent oxidoreductase
MAAAVLYEYGGAPRYGQFRTPTAGPGQVVVEVGAAALHHLDLLKASGSFYLGPPPLPSVVGTDGVGRLADGRRVYFDETVAPFGSMAERTLAGADELFDVPDGIDDATAAALGNTALAGWLAVAWRSGLTPGETVLVLGATGALGTIAVQAAKLLGAGRVVAAARRSDRLPQLLDRGADAIVELSADGDVTAAIRDAAGGDVDITIDPLWGEPALAALRATARYGRHIEVGHLAAPTIELSAPALRSASIEIRGFSVAHPPIEVRREAYRELTTRVLRGELVVDLEPLPLSEIETAWARQKQGHGGRKLVLIPHTAREGGAGT